MPAQLPPAPDSLPLPIVDDHCHLDTVRSDGPALSPAEAIAQAAAVGVNRIVQIGCDLVSARETVRLLDAHPQLLGGVALHPNESPGLVAAGELDGALAEIEQLSSHPRVRVIGETGLDYFRTTEEGHRQQQESFRAHIDLAKRTGKVLQIHDRDAHQDVLDILREVGSPDRTVFHCFSGDIEMARECVERGYYLSFAGTVTFKNAHSLRNALSVVPLDRVLVETDAPYLTPSPHRGDVNASYLMPLTVRVMAGVLGVAVPNLCTAISDNAERIYGPW